jgi:outer membrane lipoprotein SlyB
MKLSRMIILSLFLSALTSCSSTPSRPELYPNQTLKDKGNEKAQTDINECLKESEAYLKTPEGEKLRKSADSSSVSVGTSLGFGFGGGTSLGLGMGMGGGRDRQLSGEEQVRRNYTNQCLVNRGYQIVGWGK